MILLQMTDNVQYKQRETQRSKRIPSIYTFFYLCLNIILCKFFFNMNTSLKMKLHK